MQIRRSVLRLVSAAAMALAGGHAVMAKDYYMSFWVPATHVYVSDFLLPMFREIEERSEGRMSFKLLPQPVASAAGHLDAVRQGIADIAFVSTGYLPGKFELAQIGAMPGQSTSAVVRGVAFQRLYDEYLASSFDELDGVKNLGYFSVGYGTVWSGDRKITDVGDMQGAKIRVSGGLILQLAEYFGATPISKPASEAYELMSGAIIDGILLPPEGICSFQMQPLIKNVLDLPGGAYGDGNIVIMNEAAYDGLSNQDKALLDEYIGEGVARRAGAANDAVNEKCETELKSMGISFNSPTDALAAKLKAFTDQHIEVWKDEAEAHGIDADAAVDYYYNQLAELSGEQ